MFRKTKPETKTEETQTKIIWEDYFSEIEKRIPLIDIDTLQVPVNLEFPNYIHFLFHRSETDKTKIVIIDGKSYPFHSPNLELMEARGYFKSNAAITNAEEKEARLETAITEYKQKKADSIIAEITLVDSVGEKNLQLTFTTLPELKDAKPLILLNYDAKKRIDYYIDLALDQYKPHKIESASESDPDKDEDKMAEEKSANDDAPAITKYRCRIS